MAKVTLAYPITNLSGPFGGGKYRKGSKGSPPILEPRPPRGRSRKEGEKCACKAWKYADRLWTMKAPAEEAWRKALKKSGMSSYDLYMKEALRCANDGNYYPIWPSVSGGYSLDKVKPGRWYQPPYLCIKSYFKSFKAEIWYQTPTQTHWKVNFVSDDPRKNKIGIAGVSIYYHGNGFTQPGVLVASAPGWYCNGDHYAPKTEQPFWITYANSLDGTWSGTWCIWEIGDINHIAWSVPRSPWLCIGPWD